VSSPADAIAVPRAPRPFAQGSLFLLAVSPLWTRAVATPAVRFFGISGGDDPSHLCRNALLLEPLCASTPVAAPAASVRALRFDLATAAEAEPRQ
jgi:hypothetical protein